VQVQVQVRLPPPPSQYCCSPRHRCLSHQLLGCCPIQDAAAASSWALLNAAAAAAAAAAVVVEVLRLAPIRCRCPLFLGLSPQLVGCCPIQVGPGAASWALLLRATAAAAVVVALLAGCCCPTAAAVNPISCWGYCGHCCCCGWEVPAAASC
jgi:hypothetical protein